MTVASQTEKFAGNPVEVVSGPGVVAEVYTYTRALGARRVLVVCGRQVGHLPQVEALAQAPSGTTVAVFKEVESDPSAQTVIAGGRRARDFRADVVIGIGGGSSMDAAKAIAAEARQAGWIRAQDRPGQPTAVPDDVLPIIAVPTTAGTGSEVLPFAVITFPETRRKLVLNHEALYPRYALLDPGLLVSTPRSAQVAAGMDALTHAIESYVSRTATAQSRERALTAVGLIAAHFRTAVAVPEDLVAQAQMQRAAMIAGLGFAVSRLGIVHAMALPLSAWFGVPHGLANALLLPHGMAFNRPAAVADFANLAVALGVCEEDAEAEGASHEAVVAVRDLAAQLGVPPQMREVGVEQSALARMAEDALASPHIARNPRPVTVDDIKALYDEAY